MPEFRWVKITGPDFTKVTQATVHEHCLRTMFGTFDRDTMRWIAGPEVKVEFLKDEQEARALLNEKFKIAISATQPPK